MPAIAAEAAEAALKKKQMIFIERLCAGKFTLVHHSEGRFTPMIYWQLWVCKGKKEGERGERREGGFRLNSVLCYNFKRVS